jgi:dihydroxyacetone kinase
MFLPEIYRNYTGDVLNFGLAKEQYAATHSEKANRVKFVIVGDDVAVGRTQGKIVGRRYILFIFHVVCTTDNHLQRTCWNRLGI